jgi:uncharacterized membrane protein YccC
VVRACFEPLPGLAHRFESSTRHLLHTHAIGQDPRNEQNRLLLAWMFSVMEIGRAIIHLRQDSASLRLPPVLAQGIRESIAATALLFRHPSDRQRDIVLARVAHAMEAISAQAAAPFPDAPHRDLLRRLLTSLHLIRTALLDEDTVPGAAIAPRKGRLAHAS